MNYKVFHEISESSLTASERLSPTSTTLSVSAETEQSKIIVKTSKDTSLERTDRYGMLLMNPELPNCDDVANNEAAPGTCEGTESYLLDIVAVHGITGDAYHTWTHENKTLWLRDFLPEDFPGVRVFSFGYDAEVCFTKSQGDIDSFARSLLEGVKRERWGKEVRQSIHLSWATSHLN